MTGNLDRSNAQRRFRRLERRGAFSGEGWPSDVQKSGNDIFDPPARASFRGARPRGLDDRGVFRGHLRCRDRVKVEVILHLACDEPRSCLRYGQPRRLSISSSQPEV